MVCSSEIFSISANWQKNTKSQFIFQHEEVGQQMLLACLVIIDCIWWDCKRRWSEKRTGVGGVGKLQGVKRECGPPRNSKTFKIGRGNYFSYANGKKINEW